LRKEEELLESNNIVRELPWTLPENRTVRGAGVPITALRDMAKKTCWSSDVVSVGVALSASSGNKSQSSWTR
jgi:hypothetical protein